MRLSPFLLLLPAMAVADGQNPLKEKAAAWINKAKSYIPSVTPPAPIDAGETAVAGVMVETITKNNWRRKMLSTTDSPNNRPREWLVIFTGNTSCYGRCEQPDKAFNESAAILASTLSPPKLGRIDCDKDNLLCTTWSASIPEIWHFLISVPTGGRSSAPSPLHIVPIYPKNVTAQDIVKIHTEKAYLSRPEYTGAYHPIDGWLQQFGLLEPLGYVIWAVGSTPSWLFMIGVSFLSRQLMARRVGGGRPGSTGIRPPAPAGAAQQ